MPNAGWVDLTARWRWRATQTYGDSIPHRGWRWRSSRPAPAGIAARSTRPPAPAGGAEAALGAPAARRDRGEFDAAVVGLQGAALDSSQMQPWRPRLWYAYAEALLDAGRRDEALRWFESVAAIDEEGATDAEQRVDALSTDS